MSTLSKRIAILGAGPTGLDAALAAADAGLPFIVFEAAPAVGAHLRAWGHVRLFTPWSMNVSPRMRRHLGAEAPANHGELPTGDDLAGEVLAPVAKLSAIAPHIRCGVRVLSVGRQGLLKHEEISTPARAERPFRLLVSSEGREWIEEAGWVLDTTGTWGHPNPLGDGGIPAPGERALGDQVRHDIPNVAASPGDWAGQTVLVAGAGHSAQSLVRQLAAVSREAPSTRVVWVLRKSAPAWGSPPNDPLPARASLAAEAEQLSTSHPGITVKRGSVVEEIARPNDRFVVTLRRLDERPERIEVDRVVALTGAVGDHALYRQLQVHECYATCGPMKLSAALLGGSSDCLEQISHGVDTLVNPEPGFFILGSKSYGRNTTFLLRVGWQQVDEVFGLLTAR
jgi:hypothetical protein